MGLGFRVLWVLDGDGQARFWEMEVSGYTGEM